MGTSARRADSTRRMRPRPVRVFSVVRRRRAAPKMPDFSQIMSHLADAIAFIRVSHRSLDHLEVAFEAVATANGACRFGCGLYRDRLGIHCALKERAVVR